MTTGKTSDFSLPLRLHTQPQTRSGGPRERQSYATHKYLWILSCRAAPRPVEPSTRGLCRRGILGHSPVSPGGSSHAGGQKAVPATRVPRRHLRAVFHGSFSTSGFPQPHAAGPPNAKAAQGIFLAGPTHPSRGLEWRRRPSLSSLPVEKCFLRDRNAAYSQGKDHPPREAKRAPCADSRASSERIRWLSGT